MLGRIYWPGQRAVTPPLLIPLANLYYLLCYAWNILPVRGVASAARVAEEGPGAGSLLTHLLVMGLAQRARRGVPAAFTAVDAIGPHPRGRLLPGRLARQPTAAARGHLPSRYAALTLDTPLNRLIVTALRRVLRADLSPAPLLPRPLRHGVRAALAPLAGVPTLGRPGPAEVAAAAQTLPLTDATAHLVLRAAELLVFNLLPTTQNAPDESAARFRFYDFQADDAQMGRLFEAFVRNFLRREQRAAAVSSEVLRWRGATATMPAALPLLPMMRTDITLTTPERRLVIETKYYARPLAGSRYADERLLAAHLYQLLAYLRNQPVVPGQRVEGLLLYPASAASTDLRLDYQLEGYRVQVRTLNLAAPWPQIRQSLLALVAD